MTRKWLHSIVLVLMVALLSLGLVVMPDVPPVQAAGGSYQITTKAADPEYYIPPIPFPGAVIPPTGGRSDGNLLIPSAEFSTGVPSLSPDRMALGQIVPFEFHITVNSDDVSGDQGICFVYKWSTNTTSNGDFGYDHEVGDDGILSAFVDTSDPSYDGTSPATVSSFAGTYIGPQPGNKGNLIEGTFCVSGLESNDSVVVEVWVVLDSTIPTGVTGSVDAEMVEAYTGTSDTINVGANNIPLLQVGDFLDADVDLAVVKDDDDIWKAVNEPFKYTLTVSYPSGTYDGVANGVVVVDTLDPWLDYLSDEAGYEYTIDPALTRYCEWADDDTDGLGGTLTCDLRAMLAGDVVTVEFWVQAVPGVPLGSLCEGAHELSPATSCATECPSTDLSPTGSDVCNRVELTTISNDTNDTNDWDEEPKDIKYPTPVTLISFTATGLSGAIQLDWETSNEVENAGFNLYRAPSLKGHQTKLNAELIPTLQPPGSLDGALYQYVDMTAPGRATYYYWLEDVDLHGYTELHGPVSARKLKKPKPQ